jgi:Tfp pilus assembly protein PilO
MTGAKKSTWIGGAVFLSVVISALAWFLVISPILSTAAETRASAQDTRDGNVLLQTINTKLKAQMANLPQYQADLATLRAKVPADACQAEYLRQLNEIAASHTVVITSLAPATPATFVLAGAAAPAAPASTDTPEGEGESSENAEEVPAAPAGPVVPAGLTAIPFTITVVGTYDNTQAFLYDLQNATPRVFLVSNFTGTSQQEAAATGGRPATKDGDQELVITGYTYVLPDSESAAAVDDPAATPAPLPGLTPGKNPLVPVDGR